MTESQNIKEEDEEENSSSSKENEQPQSSTECNESTSDQIEKSTSQEHSRT